MATLPNPDDTKAGAAQAPASPPPEEPQPSASGDNKKAPGEITALAAQKLVTFLAGKPSNKDIEDFFTNTIGPMLLADGNAKAMVESWKQWLLLEPTAAAEALKNFVQLSAELKKEKDKELRQELIDFRTAWLKQYTEIIQKGISGQISIRETKLQMAQFGVMFGSLLQGLGVLFNRPELAEMGKGFVDRNFAEGNQMGLDIIALKGQADEIARSAPAKWRETLERFRTNAMPEGLDAIATMGRANFPGYADRQRRRGVESVAGGTEPSAVPIPSVHGGAVISGSGATSGSGHNVEGKNGKFVLKPYSEKTLQGLVRAMGRPSQYDDELKSAAGKFGLDWRELKLRMLVESSGVAFENGAPKKSIQGAVGLMQFMPGTAASLGIDPADPKQSIHGAAQLIAESLKKHGGRTDFLDSEYYGGSDTKQWGPNTRQYVENLKRLRQATMGNDVIEYDVSKLKLVKAKDTIRVAEAKPTNPNPEVFARVETERLLDRMGVKRREDSVQPPFEQASGTVVARADSSTRAPGAAPDAPGVDGPEDGKNTTQVRVVAKVERLEPVMRG